MIVTVTPSPSIDRTLHVASLGRGRLNRADAASSDPGGKGVNVAVALARNGYDTTAIVPAGGYEQRRFADLLDMPQLELVIVSIEAGMRSNISLVEPDGLITKVNEPGPWVSAAEADRFRLTVQERAHGADWLVACGSLPEGLPETFFATLVATLPTRVAVDTAGRALLAAVDAGADLVKPNYFELADVMGDRPKTLGEVVEMATDLRRRGAGAVLVTLGADGALLVTDRLVVHGEAPVAQLTSAVGAGDALLAGYLATGNGGRQALKAGLTWAAASCELANTQMPTPEAIARQRAVLHERVDASRRLRHKAEAG